MIPMSTEPSWSCDFATRFWPSNKVQVQHLSHDTSTIVDAPHITCPPTTRYFLPYSIGGKACLMSHKHFLCGTMREASAMSPLKRTSPILQETQKFLLKSFNQMLFKATEDVDLTWIWHWQSWQCDNWLRPICASPKWNCSYKSDGLKCCPVYTL